MTTQALTNRSAKPRYISVGMSVLLHALFILLPFIIGLFQTVIPYLVPYGKGSPDAGGGATAAEKKKEEAKKQKKSEKIQVAKAMRKDLKGLIFDPNSGRDGSAQSQSKIMDDMLKSTERSHEAGNIVLGGKGTGTGGGQGKGNKGGKMGKGGVGPGGWPDGMKGGRVRFIRLEYQGEDWDDGMEAAEGADVNFLNEVKEVTGFAVSDKGESHPIRNLKLYPKGKAPPFVYMTGSNSINVSAGDMQILREYLMGGGMLFADCGGVGWNGNFRRFIQQVLPNNPLIDIPDDDGIFIEPYEFPNGAPPLWHHGGNRAMGCKNEGRWVVFYHPGNINDAWKTGNTGVSAAVAENAMEMGLNIVYYAFTKYLEKTSGDR